MPNVHDVLRWANRTAVAEEITRRGYRVSGETLNRWYRQRSEVPAVVEHIVFDLFGVGPNSTNEPPPWARALAADTADELIRRLGGLGPVVQQAAVELGLHGLPPVEPSLEEGEAPPDGQRTARRRRG